MIKPHHHRYLCVLLLVPLLTLGAEAVAAEAAMGESTSVTVVLPANSLVPLRLLETLSSDQSYSGQKFSMEVTDDINVGDVVVIPAGSRAVGEVIHAARARMLGKAGELSISARRVIVGDREIKLRASLGSSEKSNVGGALFVPFIHGKESVVPQGTEVMAKVAGDVSFVITSRGRSDEH